MRHYFQWHPEELPSELERPPSTRDIRDAARHLYQAESGGFLPRGTFDQLMLHLMSLYLEQAARGKFSAFTKSINERAFDMFYPEQMPNE